MAQDHWLDGFNYNVEEWDAASLNYETLAICRQLAHARAVFKEAIAEKPAGRFMIRSRTRVVKRHPEGIGEERLDHHRVTGRPLLVIEPQRAPPSQDPATRPPRSI